MHARTAIHAIGPKELNDIVKELSDFIDESKCSEYIQDPYTLIGRSIRHRFETGACDTCTSQMETKWYNGTVLSYDASSKTHEIAYEGEEEHCNYDLTLDLLSGDLQLEEQNLDLLSGDLQLEEEENLDLST